MALRGTTRSLTGNKEDDDTGLDRGASTFRDQRRSCGRGPLKAAARTVYRRHCEPSFASQKRPDWVLRLRKRSRKATWRQLEATRRDSLFDFTARDTFHLAHFFFLLFLPSLSVRNHETIGSSHSWFIQGRKCHYVAFLFYFCLVFFFVLGS